MAAGVSVINWLSVIWRGKGKGQYVLSAGVLLTVSWIRVTVMEPRRTSFVWKSEISLLRLGRKVVKVMAAIG